MCMREKSTKSQSSSSMRSQQIISKTSKSKGSDINILFI